HAFSKPALKSALEVLRANLVDVILAKNDEYTPTPVISHAILQYNRHRKTDFADGIVITPSHNPPAEGGFKYNLPTGGPADVQATAWIEARANDFLENSLRGIQRLAFEKAVQTAKRHDYISSYVADLENVIDMEAIRDLHIGVDPLGGAGVHYWQAIGDRYGLRLDVVRSDVDPTFRFMTLDWDGQIRMDPSSPYAMRSLVTLKDRFDVAFACDTDHDRHGIVTKSFGLLPPNYYLAASIFYLFQHRPHWLSTAQVGKTVVSSSMIDRVSESLGKKIYETPVGFKWFVDGLLDGKLGFVGEESAGASFLRRDGSVWTTDKDGIVSALLAAEMTAKMKRDPGEVYRELTGKFGEFFYERAEATASAEQKKRLKQLSKEQIHLTQLAGDPIEAILTHAPGHGAPIGGVTVITKKGWFAARPSGTEDLYKIYAESFDSTEHLKKIIEDAKKVVSKILGEKESG
ncbi:MAG: alpha-D-glucose phosphate-specific phosphoglucomutase, partial [Chlamydiae bacterium]|nr:alpha-D-glucose phosphate-specific phosphoglucomutase [Chlamydiota bacterium]